MGDRLVVQAAVEYARSNHGRFLRELMALLRFPTVSTQRRHAGDLAACARWLRDHLHDLGFEAHLVDTRGHPLVHAEWRQASGRPTVLLYGHYDVQPPEPIERWRSPPFQPTVREGRLYARGASDAKGQLFSHLKAMEAWLATTGGLPVNIRCVIDGEEEIGSPSLVPFLERRQRQLRSDLMVISDTTLPALDRPAVTYGLRGLLPLHLEVRGPSRDLHAGLYGGAVANPLQVLSTILSGLHDARGRVAIEGFYDSVRLVPAAERRYLRRHGSSDRAILAEAGASMAPGEPGCTLEERATLRPAITINAVGGGYLGEGLKSVIPAAAQAKIGIRLVPDQDPDEIEALFRRHVAAATPAGAVSRIRRSGEAASPVQLEVDHPAVRAALAAYRRGFGRPAALRRSGGTIPIVALARRILGLPILLMGFGLPDDNQHAPDESLHLGGFQRAVATSAHLLGEVAALPCAAELL